MFKSAILKLLRHHGIPNKDCLLGVQQTVIYVEKMGQMGIISHF